MAILPGKKMVKPGITGITRFYWILAFGNYFFNLVICNLALSMHHAPCSSGICIMLPHVYSSLCLILMLLLMLIMVLMLMHDPYKCYSCSATPHGCLMLLLCMPSCLLMLPHDPCSSSSFFLPPHAPPPHACLSSWIIMDAPHACQSS